MIQVVEIAFWATATALVNSLPMIIAVWLALKIVSDLLMGKGR